VHWIYGSQELSSLGIRFLATSQGLDTDESNPASKLLLHILAAVAQFAFSSTVCALSSQVTVGMRLPDRSRPFGQRLKTT
jgi:DNA invertase Pin-like site-specific DNA recombinase